MFFKELVESFVIANDEFEDYLNRTTEQLASEIQGGKNLRDAVHDLSVQFSKQHNNAYAAYQRMSDALIARATTLELEAGSEDMGMEPEMGDMSMEPEMGDMGMEPEMGGIDGMDVDLGDEMDAEPTFSDDEVIAMGDSTDELGEACGKKHRVKEGKGSDYKLYHDTYTSAVTHAMAFTKKVYGLEPTEDEIWNKISTGPAKPGSGKTNRLILDLVDSETGKPSNQKLHMQVYNMDNQSYELNMYVQGGGRVRNESNTVDPQVSESPAWDSHNTDVRPDKVRRGPVEKPVSFKAINKQLRKRAKTEFPSWKDAMNWIAGKGGVKAGWAIISESGDSEITEGMKPYVSSSSPDAGRPGSYDVIGKDGKVVKSYPYNKKGKDSAMRHLSRMFKESSVNETGTSPNGLPREEYQAKMAELTAMMNKLVTGDPNQPYNWNQWQKALAKHGDKLQALQDKVQALKVKPEPRKMPKDKYALDGDTLPGNRSVSEDAEVEIEEGKLSRKFHKMMTWSKDTTGSPKDMEALIRSYSDEELLSLRGDASDEKAGSGSARAAQVKMIAREIKRRGLEEATMDGSNEPDYFDPEGRYMVNQDFQRRKFKLEPLDGYEDVIEVSWHSSLDDAIDAAEVALDQILDEFAPILGAIAGTASRAVAGAAASSVLSRNNKKQK